MIENVKLSCFKKDFFLSKRFTRFTKKTILQNKLWNNDKKINREKAYNKTMTKAMIPKQHLLDVKTMVEI